MIENIKYGEIKTRKNIFPKDAQEMVDKGTIGILISQCKVSDKTKGILLEGKITLYENVEQNEVEQIREAVREKSKEKPENERSE